jgi:dihydrofolate reductase
VGRVRVAGFSVSLDGFGAGPEQSLQDPLGKRGTELHSWFFGTKTFKAMFGEGGGSEGVDETFAHRSMDGFGAFILGRNMFGPVRGEWLDDSWKGWWGDNPPYHAPTFVLTHHAREPIVMEGGSTSSRTGSTPRSSAHATPREHATSRLEVASRQFANTCRPA